MVRRQCDFAARRRAGRPKVALLVAALVGLWLVLAVSPPALAQSALPPGQGALQTVSYHELPERLAVAVVLFDDSDLNLKIQEQMLAALARAEHGVGGEAVFDLELESEGHSGGVFSVVPSLGRVTSSRDDSRIEMNIWSSSQDSILGGRHSDRERRIPNRFAIRATLRDRGSGEVVWDGSAVVEAQRDQAEPYILSMVEALVRSFGQTVRDGRFPAP